MISPATGNSGASIPVMDCAVCASGPKSWGGRWKSRRHQAGVSACGHASPLKWRKARMSKTRVMIVDDHEVVRLGMRAAFELEADLAVVGEASNGVEALAKMPVLAPELILMDVRMDKMNGIEACREIKSRYPGVRILMLTSYADDEAVAASVMAGGSGYLLKNVSRAELLRAIRLAAAGQSLLDSKVTKQVMERLQVQAPGNELTEREREVLALVARGYTNK